MTAMELRSDGPTFEEVGSPSKIPRYRAPLPRAHPGATANISRAEVLPQDDELVDEYDEDNESLCPNSDDDYVEQDEVYSEEAPNREQQQLPAKFFQEELGPPSIEEESLQALDDQATMLTLVPMCGYPKPNTLYSEFECVQASTVACML